MKKRYTVSIAGYELKVISDETPELIDETVACLDRKVRTLCDSHKMLPKNEALILTALESIAEQKKLTARVAELEQALYGEGGEVAGMRREIALLRAYIGRRNPAALGSEASMPRKDEDEDE